MALEFLNPPSPEPKNGPARVAVFPGAWNPPTIAHLEIARAAASWADEVLWIIPRAFPHKAFDGASFDARCRMLAALMREHARFSAATAEGGLYAEIADEALAHYGPATEIALVCGRDAAERLVTWDYGQPDFVARMLRRFRILVAERGARYRPPEHHRHGFIHLPLPASHHDVSSSEVRHRVKQGGPWWDLVPPAIHDEVRRIYIEDATKLSPIP